MPQELPELTVESRTQNVQQIQSYMESKGFEGFDASEASDAIQEQETEEQPAEQAEGEEQEVAEDAVGGNEDDNEEEPAAPAAGKKPAQTQQQQEEKKPSRRARAAARAKAEMEIQRKQWESRFEAQQRELEELKKGFATSRQESEQKKASDADPKPKYADFENEDDPHSAYTEALSRWAFREERRNEEKAKGQTAEKPAERRTSEEKPAAQVDDQPAADRERKAQVARWEAQVEVGKATYDDWDQVMNRPHPADKPICSPAMSCVIMSERPDDGADILYWVATHEDEAHQMFKETALGENPSPKEIRQMFDRVHKKFDALKLLGDDQQQESDDEEGTETTSRETRDVATRSPNTPQTRQQQQPRPADAIRARQAQQQQQQTTTQSTPRPKMDPPKPLGSRSVVTRKSVDEMTKSDFARLGDSAADEYRRLRERR